VVSSHFNLFGSFYGTLPQSRSGNVFPPKKNAPSHWNEVFPAAGSPPTEPGESPCVTIESFGNSLGREVCFTYFSFLIALILYKTKAIVNQLPEQLGMFQQ
jgi:hypothetical protein